MWATDYPHSGGFSPGAPEMIGKRPKPPLPSEAKKCIGRGQQWGSMGCINGRPAGSGKEVIDAAA
jgi:hypothetical protein